MDPIKGDDETLDSFYHGRIRVLQKKHGYRFSVDAPLLADFIQTQAADEILELGTGSGIISLLLSIKPFQKITALEIQPDLFELALKNVKLNRLEKKITILQKDLKTYEPQNRYDVIFSNPPYYQKGKGLLSPSREKSIAKHELKCDIFDIMSKTSGLLKPEGRAYFVIREDRRVDLMQAAAEVGLKSGVSRLVLPRRLAPPSLCLFEIQFNPKMIRELKPLILFKADGTFTKEAQEIFAGRPHA